MRAAIPRIARNALQHERFTRTTKPTWLAGSAQAIRCFHDTATRSQVKPFNLADVGEGITECQIIQWFVQPGARVEEFDKLCEVQSDKASVEITSPWAGVIHKLHYEPEDMAITGKPLLDIDTEDDELTMEAVLAETAPAERPELASDPLVPEQAQTTRPPHKSLASPAVRHLVRERGLSIEDIAGSGKDGRVLREDVLNHESNSGIASDTRISPHGERRPLTAVQQQMFRTMTRSLSIPHFLYSCSADMSRITLLRRSSTGGVKITAFAFILKAVSVAFKQHSLLNSSLDLSEPDKPALFQHEAHNFGIAIDTPSGLLVPVIRNVQDMTIEQVALAIQQISAKARDGALSPSDFSKASFTLSNIGAIGGGVVSPVISAPQVAIVGIGRSNIVPAFDVDGNLYRREEIVLSWSADHRVVDGAECARCAERVRSLLESPEAMLLSLR